MTLLSGSWADLAIKISRLFTGPTVACRTGIFNFPSSKARASSPPTVSALMTTPLVSSSAPLHALVVVCSLNSFRGNTSLHFEHIIGILSKIVRHSCRIAFFEDSFSSGVLARYKVVPAMVSSRFGATIFTPHAASTFSKLTQRLPASRISDIPFGRLRPLICVVNGPLLEASINLSPIFNSPRYRITSMVLPIPTSSRISRTVPSAEPSVSVSRSSRKRSARPTVTANRSCNPSPSLADIGTTATFWRKSRI